VKRTKLSGTHEERVSHLRDLADYAQLTIEQFPSIKRDHIESKLVKYARREWSVGLNCAREYVSHVRLVVDLERGQMQLPQIIEA